MLGAALGCGASFGTLGTPAYRLWICFIASKAERFVSAGIVESPI